MTRSVRPAHVALRAGVTSLQRTAFWVAVVLPLLYPAVLLFTAWIPDAGTVLAGLVGIHSVSLLLGHAYRREATAGGNRDGGTSVGRQRRQDLVPSRSD